MEIVQPIRNKRDIERMKKALAGNKRNYLLFVLGINTGLRISDLLRLRVGDVRGKTTLTLREKKTGKVKRFKFNRSIIEVARDIDGDDNEYLFRSRQGGNKPISRQQAWNILNQAAAKVGIGEVGTHTLRKTFGYHAYRAGVDLSVIQSIFNHASQSVTLRYIGIQQDDIDNVYDAVCL